MIYNGFTLLLLLLTALPALADDWQVSRTPEAKKLAHYRDLRTKDDLERELYRAIRSRDSLGVKVLLKSFAKKFNFDPNTAIPDKLFSQAISVDPSQIVFKEPATPWLHLTARVGNAEMVKSFVSHGANPNAKDERGNTALHVATASVSQATAETLLKMKSIDVNVTNSAGDTPLALVLASQNSSLIPSFAKLKAKLPEKVAGRPLADYLFYSDNYVAINAFFPKRADVERLAKNALHQAATANAIRTAKLLMHKYKYSLWDKEPKSGMNVVETALANTRHDLYEVFLDADSKVAKFKSDRFGFPIEIAYNVSDLDLAEKLFKLGTPLVTLRDNGGKKAVDTIALTAAKSYVETTENILKKKDLSETEKKKYLSELAHARKLSERIVQVAMNDKVTVVPMLQEAFTAGPSQLPLIEKLAKKSGQKLEKLLEYVEINPFHWINYADDRVVTQNWLATKHDLLEFYLKLFGSFDAFDQFLKKMKSPHTGLEFLACRALVADDVKSAKLLLKKIKPHERVYCPENITMNSNEFNAIDALQNKSVAVARLLAPTRSNFTHASFTPQGCVDELYKADKTLSALCTRFYSFSNTSLRDSAVNEKQEAYWKPFFEGKARLLGDSQPAVKQNHISTIDIAILMDEPELTKILLAKKVQPTLYHRKFRSVEESPTPVNMLSVACALKFKNHEDICKEQAGRYSVITADRAFSVLDWAFDQALMPSFLDWAPKSQQNAVLKRLGAIARDYSIPKDIMANLSFRYLDTFQPLDYLNRLIDLDVVDSLLSKYPENARKLLSVVGSSGSSPTDALAFIQKLSSAGVHITPSLVSDFVQSSVSYETFEAVMVALQKQGVDLAEPFPREHSGEDVTLLYYVDTQNCSEAAQSDKKILWLVKHGLSPHHARKNGTTFWDSLFGSYNESKCVQPLVAELMKMGYDPFEKRKVAFTNDQNACYDATYCPAFSLLEDMRFKAVTERLPTTNDSCRTAYTNVDLEIIQRSSRVLEWTKEFVELVRSFKKIEAALRRYSTPYEQAMLEFYWGKLGKSKNSMALQAAEMCCQINKPSCYVSQTSTDDSLNIRKDLTAPVCAMLENEKLSVSKGEFNTLTLDLSVKSDNGGQSESSVTHMPHAASSISTVLQANTPTPAFLVVSTSTGVGYPMNGRQGRKVYLEVPLNDDGALAQMEKTLSPETLKAFSLDSRENYMRAYYPTCAQYLDQWSQERNQAEGRSNKTAPEAGPAKAAPTSDAAQKVR